MARIAICLIALLMLAGCAAPPRQRTACLLPGQSPLIIAQLFFGRQVPGRDQPVSDVEWSEFVSRVVAANFPDGFTVVDADGKSLSPQTDRLVREPTKILIAAADPESEPAARIAAVINAYRKQFNQRSVGVVTAEECGAF